LKRVFYSLLILAMVAGLTNTAFAGIFAPSYDGKLAAPAFSDIAGHKAEAALTLMAALGIFTGENGLGNAVKPDDPITRAQFCKVLVVAVGKARRPPGSRV